MPIEEQYANPAKIKVGEAMVLNTLDFSHLLFKVAEIQEWKRIVEGNTRSFTDYCLVSVGDPDTQVILRMIPTSAASDAASTHNCVGLTKFFECGWDNEDERKGILQGLEDPQGKMVFQAGTENEKVFWRINSKEPYDCDVTILADRNGNGKIEKDEVSHAKIRMWDFYCKNTKDGVEVTEFLYVHHDLQARDFVMWLGEEVNPKDIQA